MLVVVIVTGTLQAVPAAIGGNEQEAAAQSLEVDRAPIELPDATAADREPIDVPAQLNNVPGVEDVVPRFSENASTPDDAVRDSVPAEEAGDPTTDAYASEPLAGDHLAVVFPSSVNTENAKGEWIDLDLSPSRDGDRWSMEGAGWEADCPESSSLDTLRLG
jgi:hypothetical protein